MPERLSVAVHARVPSADDLVTRVCAVSGDENGTVLTGGEGESEQ